MKKLKLNVHILYPGGFKPFHGGHMDLAINAIEAVDKMFNYQANVRLHLIFSRKTRDGVQADTTKYFLDDVLHSGLCQDKIDYIICDGSPVREAYNIVATKQYGNGYYLMLASTKDEDQKRVLDFVDAFKIDGKYHKEGITAMACPTKLPLKYSGRTDGLDGEIISSRIIRDDLRNSDPKNFEAAYPYRYFPHRPFISSYYVDLKNDMRNAGVFESAAPGHINHPYEEDDMTFQEINDMIIDIFNGNVEDITEKIDGMNIMASVDTTGKPIFARNKSQMIDHPMTLDDIKENKNWTDSVHKAFVNGAETIAAIFKNIRSAKEVFNEDDKLDRLVYRTWCNFEIADIDAQNVIPYVENIINLNGFLATCTDYNIDSTSPPSIIEVHSSNVERLKPLVLDAMKITNHTYFKTNSPQNVFISAVSDERGALVSKHILKLMDLCEEYELTFDNTIKDFKKVALKRYLTFNGFSDMTNEEIDLAVGRLLGTTRVAWSVFDEKHREKLKSLDKGKKEALLKRLMLPVDKLFIDIGNDVIKSLKGIKNEGNEKAAVEKIKKGIVDAIDIVSASKDERKIEKLEYLLTRLGDNPEIYPSEGVVYKYKGRTYKLTGSFAAINQIKNLVKK